MFYVTCAHIKVPDKTLLILLILDCHTTGGRPPLNTLNACVATAIPTRLTSYIKTPPLSASVHEPFEQKANEVILQCLCGNV